MRTLLETILPLFMSHHTINYYCAYRLLFHVYIVCPLYYCYSVTNIAMQKFSPLLRMVKRQVYLVYWLAPRYDFSPVPLSVCMFYYF